MKKITKTNTNNKTIFKRYSSQKLLRRYIILPNTDVNTKKGESVGVLNG